MLFVIVGIVLYAASILPIAMLLGRFTVWLFPQDGPLDDDDASILLKCCLAWPLFIPFLVGLALHDKALEASRKSNFSLARLIGGKS